MRRFAIGWALLVGLVLPASAQRAPAGPVPSRPPGIWLDVPFFAQRKKNACGAASLAMLMRYWEAQAGKPASSHPSEASIDHSLDPLDQGIANTSMAAYLRHSGYRVFTFAGRWHDLRENLTKGRPLIVALGPEGKKGPLHYVVVAGIDWRRNFVFVNDPAKGKLFRMSRERFLAEWRATGEWTLLAVPKEPM